MGEKGLFLVQLHGGGLSRGGLRVLSLGCNLWQAPYLSFMLTYYCILTILLHIHLSLTLTSSLADIIQQRVNHRRPLESASGLYMG